MNRRAQDALDAYTTPIIRAIKTIAVEQVFVSFSPQPSDSKVRVAEISSPQRRPLKLRTSERSTRLWLRFRVSLLIVEQADAPDTVGIELDSYSFQLFRGDGQSRFDEIVTYHWTPNDLAAKRSWPHLHIGSAFIDPAARREPWALHKTHFLTGPITAAGFVRMAVEEFGVEPLTADWEQRLAAEPSTAP